MRCTEIFKVVKSETFQYKNFDIFLTFAQNILWVHVRTVSLCDHADPSISINTCKLFVNYLLRKYNLMCFRVRKQPLRDRMVRRYSEVLAEDTDEAKSNSGLSSISRRRQSSASSTKSARLQAITRKLSEEEAEYNKERLAVLGDLMSVFYDEEDDFSSDQDDFLEELHDVGYLITPKDMKLGTKAENVFDEDDAKRSKDGQNIFKKAKHKH